MICLSLRAFFCVALSVFTAVPVQAAQNIGECKADGQKIKVVKQPDGSEIVRLSVLVSDQKSAVPATAELVHEQRLNKWLESVVEPRLMTALATLPGMSRNEGQNLPEVVDPAMVRSWAEFIDPALALSWQAFAQMDGFSEALLRRPDQGAKVLKSWGVSASQLSAPWVNTRESTAWSHVVSEGAKRSIPSRQALQEWLMLPSPEPKSNPWLSNLGSYRY